jgi:hypothetical protein
MRRRIEVWALDGEEGTTGDEGLADISWVMIRVYAWKVSAE